MKVTRLSNEKDGAEEQILLRNVKVQSLADRGDGLYRLAEEEGGALWEQKIRLAVTWSGEEKHFVLFEREGAFAESGEEGEADLFLGHLPEPWDSWQIYGREMLVAAAEPEWVALRSCSRETLSSCLVECAEREMADAAVDPWVVEASDQQNPRTGGVTDGADPSGENSSRGLARRTRWEEGEVQAGATPVIKLFQSVCNRFTRGSFVLPTKKVRPPTKSARSHASRKSRAKKAKSGKKSKAKTASRKKKPRRGSDDDDDDLDEDLASDRMEEEEEPEEEDLSEIPLEEEEEDPEIFPEEEEEDEEEDEERGAFEEEEEEDDEEDEEEEEEDEEDDDDEMAHTLLPPKNQGRLGRRSVPLAGNGASFREKASGPTVDKKKISFGPSSTLKSSRALSEPLVSTANACPPSEEGVLPKRTKHKRRPEPAAPEWPSHAPRRWIAGPKGVSWKNPELPAWPRKVDFEEELQTDVSLASHPSFRRLARFRAATRCAGEFRRLRPFASLLPPAPPFRKIKKMPSRAPQEPFFTDGVSTETRPDSSAALSS